MFDLEEFNIYTKVIDLPLDGIPTYLEEGINGVCTGGSALFNVLDVYKRQVIYHVTDAVYDYKPYDRRIVNSLLYNPDRLFGRVFAQSKKFQMLIVPETDFNLLHLALPLGISFFTFQQLAFLIDSYRCV